MKKLVLVESKFTFLGIQVGNSVNENYKQNRNPALEPSRYGKGKNDMRNS